MPDTPTPGQMAYAAYLRTLFEGMPTEAYGWGYQSPATHAAWEAAAQAVLEGCALLCPICGAELERCNAKDTHG